MSQAEVLRFPAEHASPDGGVAPLSDFARGDMGVIIRVGDEQALPSSLGDEEIERRLLELGFVEGARIELLHEGTIGRDPIAVRLDDTMRVALRRREAANVIVRRTGRRR